MAETPKLVTVQFTRSYTVRDADETHYEEGDEVELTRDSADHFINRGAAVEVDQKAKPKAKPKEAS